MCIYYYIPLTISFYCHFLRILAKNTSATSFVGILVCSSKTGRTTTSLSGSAYTSAQTNWSGTPLLLCAEETLVLCYTLRKSLISCLLKPVSVKHCIQHPFHISTFYVDERLKSGLTTVNSLVHVTEMGKHAYNDVGTFGKKNI